LVRMLEQLQKENERLKADARVYRDLEARVQAENEVLSRSLAAAEQKRDELTRQIADLRTTIRDLELARAERTPPDSPEASAAEHATAAPAVVDWVRQPKLLLLGAVGVLAAGGLAWAVFAAWKRQRPSTIETTIERDSI
jgi:seryl-tRNA synthetase